MVALFTTSLGFLTIPDHYEHIERRAARALNMMLLIQTAVVLPLFIFQIAFQSISFSSVVFIQISVNLAVYIISKYLLNKGYLRPAGLTMIVTQAFTLGGAILLDGGIRDMKAVAFIALIAMSSIILDRRDTILVGLLTILIGVLLFLAEALQVVLVESADMATTADLAVILSVMAVVIVVMMRATEQINQAYADIRYHESRIDHDNQLLSEEAIFHQQAEQELLATNQHLASVTDNLEANVAKRTEALRNINHDLETLLQVTSLDLKEPLQAIRLNSHEVLEDWDNNLSAKGLDYLSRVARAADRMELLLNDVIKISQVQQLDKVTTTTDLNEVVHKVQERLEAQIEECGAQIQVHEILPTLNVDELWVSEAVYNLVSNALKYAISEETRSHRNHPLSG